MRAAYSGSGTKWLDSGKVGGRVWRGCGLYMMLAHTTTPAYLPAHQTTDNASSPWLFCFSGAVPWLAQLLVFGGAGAKEAAAACLAELAAVGPAVQQQIRDAGAVEMLGNLQSSGDWLCFCFNHSRCGD